MKSLPFYLVAILVASIAGCGESAPPPKPAAGPVLQTVDAGRFNELSKTPGIVILDVRTPSEFAGGHIHGAVNMDVNAPDFGDRVAKLDKSRTYLVHCQGGVRSTTACRRLEDADFATVYNLDGGIKAWRAAGLPVEK